MDKRILFVALIFIIFFGNVFAVLDTGSLKIFAVTEDGKGMAADLRLDTFPGSGYVTFVTSNINGADHPLIGNDTQTTGNIALKIAKAKLVGAASGTDFGKYNYQFDIIANATEVDGPSAGAAMTLLAYSVLSERKIPTGVGLTGTINSDGTVGVVGGVYAKSKAAAGVGIKLFMIPEGEAVQVIKDDDGKVKSVNLLSYGPEQLNMKIVEVETIDDVLKYAYADIGSIVVDANAAAVTGFTPKPIKYETKLEPMKGFSKNFIDRANALQDEAKKDLEVTDLDEYWKGIFYPQINEAQRDIESAQIFFDQNYLYSSANYAFNAAITLGTIKEIAESPSLLSNDSTILSSKISSLRSDIEFLKQKFDYIPTDKLDWIISAQQRIAYAENALNSIEELQISSDATEAEQKGLLYGKVRDFVSAQLWIEAAKDFLDEGNKSALKKVPFYSQDFIVLVVQKVMDVNAEISSAPDKNVSPANVSEAQRRLDSAKISYDNNFYFAALYDAYFADSFISSELKQKEFTEADLFTTLDAEIKSVKSESKSEWADLFLDHARFYLESANFYESQGGKAKAASDISASFSTLFLAKNVNTAREIVDGYIASAKFQDKSGSPLVQITYTEKPDFYRQIIFSSGIALVIVLVLIIILGMGASSRKTRGSVNSRIMRLQYVLSNLDKSLGRKKVSEVEYFFLKKRYDVELNELMSRKRQCSEIILTLDESKAKLKALQRGLKDLKKHYNGGLILPDDYVKHSLEVSQEIASLQSQVEKSQFELKNKRQVPVIEEVCVIPSKRHPFAKIPDVFLNLKNALALKISLIRLPRGQKLKGTAEIAKDELLKEMNVKEKELRKETIAKRKFKRTKKE
ncbi:MAG: S16 family serine protease [archaeon]|jgi:uncharacterized protein